VARRRDTADGDDVEGPPGSRPALGLSGGIVITRSPVRIFHTHVAGLGERDPDGTDRHTRARACQLGERLTLARESGRRSGGTVLVVRLSGEQLGRLPRHWLRRVGRRMTRGWRYAAVVTGLSDAVPAKRPRRLAIAVFVGKPSVPDEVWEAALEAETAPARRVSLLWVVLAAAVAVVIVWLAAR
jgi:hypothetical protein